MSSIVDFKTKLAVDFSRKLNKLVRPRDVILGSVSSPSFPTLRNSHVVATIEGKEYPIAYDRFDLAALFKNVPKTFKIKTTQRLETTHELLPKLNALFGLDLQKDDIQNKAVDPEATTIVFFAAPTSYRFMGIFSVTIEQPSILLFPKPDHWFKAEGNANNDGLQATQIAYPLKFVNGPDGQKWATASVGGAGSLGNGIELPAGGEFVLDFKVFFTSFPSYVSFLTASYQANGSTGSMYWAGGKFYQYGVSGVQNTPMVANQAYRYTLRGKGGTTYLYLDGKLVSQWASAGSSLKLTSFGDQDPYTSHFPRDLIHFRDLKSYARALTDAEFKSLLESDLASYVMTQPTNEFLFDGSGANTGTAATALNVPMTFETVGRKNVGHVSGTAPVLFGNNVKLKVCGEFAIDFQVTAKAINRYLCFMAVDINAAAAVGSFFFADGKFYEYRVGPSTAAPAMTAGVPYRVTIIARGGTTALYINKAQVATYPTPAATANRYLVGFRDKDTVGQWQTENEIDYIRAWDGALNDMDIKKLFSAAPLPPQAKYAFSLQGDVGGSGSDLTQFPVTPTEYVTIGGEQMARVPMGQLGTMVMDINKDFTMSVDVVIPPLKYLTLFADPTTFAGNGALMFYYGRPYLARWGNSAGALPSPDIADGLRHNIQVRCRNGMVSLFVDGVLYDKFSNPKDGQLWTGIGDANTFSSGWPNTCALSNLQYWETGLRDDELAGVRDGVIPSPLHYWPLQRNKVNYGRDGTPWAGALNWVDFVGTTWGAVSSVTPISDIGADLPLDRDFTVDFKVVANDIGNVYGELFRKALTGGAATGDLVTWRDLGAGSKNKPTIQSVGYGSVADVKLNALKNDASNRITLTRKGDLWTFYQDGVQMWRFTAATSGALLWRYFGSSVLRSRQYLRELRYWEQVLPDATLTQLFKI